MTEEDICCDELAKLAYWDSSVYRDENGDWTVVTDEATSFKLRYCPFCGKRIDSGIEEEESEDET